MNTIHIDSHEVLFFDGEQGGHCAVNALLVLH